MDLKLVQLRISDHLEKMENMFRPGVKVTFLARTPGNDEADFVMTNDDLSDAINALERRKLAGKDKA